MKYGLPYKGSKSKIIKKIAENFPNAENFYDLFGGGFSVSHYMLLNERSNYKNFYYNEIQKPITELVKRAISGFYNYDNFNAEWVSREDFVRLKNIDAYIGLCWSFGNNGRSYLYGKEIEADKKSMHNAVVSGIYDNNYFKLGLQKLTKVDITERRLEIKKQISNLQLQSLQSLESLERLQRLQSLQSLQSLERLERLTITAFGYKDVMIRENSVIYCDIPYKGTEKYLDSFNHEEFFDWANEQENPVYISEYNIDDNRFKLIDTFYHRSTLSPKSNNKVCEKLYGNNQAYLQSKKLTLFNSSEGLK